MRFLFTLLFILNILCVNAQNDSVKYSFGLGIGINYYSWNNDITEVLFLNFQKKKHFYFLGTEYDFSQRDKLIKNYSIHAGYRFYPSLNSKIINPHFIGKVSYKFRKDEREYFNNNYNSTGYIKEIDFKSENIRNSLAIELGYGIDINITNSFYLNLNNTLMIQWDKEQLITHNYINNNYINSDFDNNPNRWQSLNFNFTIGYRFVPMK